MKDYIEERAIDIAHYIISEKATVRQTAKKFGVSKSTVHKDAGVIIGAIMTFIGALYGICRSSPDANGKRKVSWNMKLMAGVQAGLCIFYHHHIKLAKLVQFAS